MFQRLFNIYVCGHLVDSIHGKNKADAIAKARMLYKLTGHVSAVPCE